MANELADVQEELSNTYKDVLRGSDVARTLRNEISDSTIQEYKDAYGEDSAADALAEAAADGRLSDDYSGVYDRFPELREALQEAGSEAFDTDAREMLQEKAKQAQSGRYNRLCFQGEFDTVVEELGIEEPDNAADCASKAAEASGVAQQFDDLYPDDRVIS